jgi:hypothetical protein
VFVVTFVALSQKSFTAAYDDGGGWNNARFFVLSEDVQIVTSIHKICMILMIFVSIWSSMLLSSVTAAFIVDDEDTAADDEDVVVLMRCNHTVNNNS